MANLTESTIALVQEYRGWSLPIVFLLAFCESFAFVSLAVPATGILLGIGGLIAAARIEFWPIWLAAALGAIGGDWVAYELALRFKDRITQMRLFSTRPELLRRGIEFFGRWGIVAVFVGRFFGPFRAIVPLAAGLYAMPRLKFQTANVASALFWAAGILAPGFFALQWLVG
jgi:membrane protein DedA with SNARE-associated domain